MGMRVPHTDVCNVNKTRTHSTRLQFVMDVGEVGDGVKMKVNIYNNKRGRKEGKTILARPMVLLFELRCKDISSVRLVC